ncbi:MAG: glycosyltransferase [Calditrichales bacterium]|nr:MAG: glycosyltransferase [Calditrichales bacterium]
MIMPGLIPNQFHFIFGLEKQREPFHLMHYLCIESCFQINRPQAIYFYYHYEPFGYYWQLAKRRIIPEQVMLNPFVKNFRYGFKNRYTAKFRYAHHSDFIRVEKLLERGGIYADIDTIFVNPIPPVLFDKPFVMGREDDTYSFTRKQVEASLCNAFLMSEPNSLFARLWLEKMPETFDGTWSEHSCSLAHRLSMTHPESIHIEPSRSFYKHMCTQKGLYTLFEDLDPDFSGVVSMHLWSHLWWSKKRTEFSHFHADLLNEKYIREKDATYNLVARQFLPRKSMNKPNLLYISPVTPTPDGIGLAKRAYNNLKALSSYYSIYLLVMPPGRKDCHPHPEVEQLCRKQKKVPFHPVKDFWLCVELLIKKIFYFFGIKKYFQPQEWDTFSRRRINRGWEAFPGTCFSIIHVFRLYMIPLLEPYLNDFKGSVQIDLDDIESVTRNGIAKLYRQNGQEEKALKIESQAEFYREKESQELDRFNRIFVCSPEDQAFIRSKYPYPHVDVLPNVIQIPEPEDDKEKHSSPFRFLICGNFNYYPNTDGLFHFIKDILPIVSESGPKKFQIDVVGPGLKGMPKRLVDLNPWMVFHGRVPDIGPYFRAADVVLVPLRGGGGTRIKILEAFAYGKTVISTFKGAEGLPVQHNRHLLLAGNALEFANHCLKLMQEPDSGKNLEKNGRELAIKLFSSDRIKDILCHPHGGEIARRSIQADEKERIDVVYTWVNGSDPEFKHALKKALDQQAFIISNGLDNRFRDNQELRYSLRSLEAYAPWTGRIYLVTNGQVPSWLRLDHPRISVIDHRSIFPDEVSLPTFNSNAIELCLHHIPGLSKRFLYLNDDLFFGRQSTKNDYFTVSQGIRFYQEPIMISSHQGSRSTLMRSYAYTQSIIEKLWGIKYQRFLPAHTPQLYDRDILKGLEYLLADEFKKTIGHRFRSPDDLILRIMFFYYLIESPEQIPKGNQAKFLRWGSSEYSFWMLDRNFLKTAGAFLHILRKQPKFFCVNDDVTTNAPIHPLLLFFRLFLRVYFPRPSSFEK